LISPDKIEQVKDANDIVEVLSDYLQMKKAGSNFKALCPFHQEKTPSFMVSPAKQIFHCFGCHAGGNVFTFMQKIENIPFVESVKLLAKRAGIELDYAKSDIKYSEKEKLIEINKEALVFFFEAGKKSEKTARYLESRGIKPDAVEEFRLGYAPDGNALFAHLRSKGYSEEFIIKSWLCQKKEYGIIDAFRDRLIFPILNIYGEPIAFGARVFGDAMPKYINSAETAVYIKGKNLYNLNNAKKYKENYMAVVEGYMDAITLYSGGIKNVVATLGTAMTADQARLLKRHVSKIVMAYDMDDAGITGAMRGGEIAFSEGLEVKIASYSGAKDPDEFIKKNGAVALQGRLQAAAGLIEYRADYLRSKGDINNPYYKETVLKELAGLLNKTDNLVVKNDGIGKISDKTGISPEIVKQYVDLRPEEMEDAKAGLSEADLFRKKGDDMAERGILGCALDAFGREDEAVILKHLFSRRGLSGVQYQDFTNPVFAKVLEKIEGYFNAGEKDTLKKVELDYMEDDEATKTIAEVLGEESSRARTNASQDTDTAMQVINDCFLRMEKEKIRKKVNSLQAEIRKSEQENDTAKLNALVREKQQLQKILKQRGEEFE
jgi:DNA primase